MVRHMPLIWSQSLLCCTDVHINKTIIVCQQSASLSEQPISERGAEWVSEVSSESGDSFQMGNKGHCVRKRVFGASEVSVPQRKGTLQPDRSLAQHQAFMRWIIIFNE